MAHFCEYHFVYALFYFLWCKIFSKVHEQGCHYNTWGRKVREYQFTRYDKIQINSALRWLSIFAAFSIHPLNGWKNDHTLCLNKSGEFFIQCIEAAAYSQGDIVSGHQAFSYEARQFFLDGLYGGLVQSLTTENVAVSPFTYFEIGLNSSLSYKIFISDQKLQPLTQSPYTFPRLYISINNNGLEFYYKVK